VCRDPGREKCLDHNRRLDHGENPRHQRRRQYLERIRHSARQFASAGGFTVAFRNPWHGIVGGGDLDPADPNNARTATSDDGGQTWTLTNPPPVTGAIFGLSYVGRAGGHDLHSHDDGGRAIVITANDGGAAWTPDEGTTGSHYRTCLVSGQSLSRVPKRDGWSARMAAF